MAAPERALAGEMTGTWALKIMTRRGTQREHPQLSAPKTALTYTGAVHLAVPGDRAGTVEPGIMRNARTPTSSTILMYSCQLAGWSTG